MNFNIYNHEQLDIQTSTEIQLEEDERRIAKLKLHYKHQIESVQQKFKNIQLVKEIKEQFVMAGSEKRSENEVKEECEKITRSLIYDNLTFLRANSDEERYMVVNEITNQIFLILQKDMQLHSQSIDIAIKRALSATDTTIQEELFRMANSI